MSRPIAYNASGPLSGSIRGGSVNYTVDSGNRDYTTFASKKWVPSADGVAPIVFVTDSYTQGITNQATAVPLFYSCNGTGSAAIIYTANRVPGSPGNYTDANVALNDLITARGYFILESNDPFEGIDADSLVFDTDASKMSSYPQTGTSVYDLSGYGGVGSLNNGVIWNSTSGSFYFDGTDDEIYANNYTAIDMSGTQQYTAMSTVYPLLGGGTWHGIFSKGNNQQYALTINSPSAFLHYESNQSAYGALNSAGGSVDANRWQHFVAMYDGTNKTIWKNGEIIATQATPGLSSVSNTEELRIGEGNNGENFRGEIQSTRVYRRALSTAEIKQNYFGSPIITDGLVFAVDANNIVSYPKSGTAVYNLTGSGTTGTLTNGPTFKLPQGGYWSFDGTDDYLAFGDIADLGTGDFTLSVWVYIPSGTASTFRAILNKKGPSGADAGYGIYYNTGMQKFLWSTANGSSASEIFTSNTFASIENTWVNVVMVRQNGATNNGSYYVNGAYQSLASAATVLNVDSSYNLSLATAAGPYTPYCFQGDIANAKIYNKALTSDEVLQNYQAEQYRFETPAGPVTNGLLLYWDAGNLDSYPGTGTTIYDLSGNGNNGTLVNGVGFNQTNGGVLTFDGVDDYVGTSSPSLPSTNNTVMGAARYSGGTRGRMINATSNNWLIGCWNNSTENYYAEGWVSPVQNGANDTNWRIVTALGDIGADSYASYTNNILTGGPNNGGSQGPAGITVGKIGYTNSEYSTGEFGFVLVYNRILTAAEMTQNYNYFKGRFGL
jgi:hypothetical protein